MKPEVGHSSAHAGEQDYLGGDGVVETTMTPRVRRKRERQMNMILWAILTQKNSPTAHWAFLLAWARLGGNPKTVGATA